MTTIRRELEIAGRDPYAVKIFNLSTVVTAATDDEAHAMHAEYLSYGEPQGGFGASWLLRRAALRRVCEFKRVSRERAY